MVSLKVDLVHRHLSITVLITLSVFSTATTTSLTNIGTNSKGKSLGLPPATLKKPERKPPLSLRTPSQDDTSMNAAGKSHCVSLVFIGLSVIYKINYCKKLLSYN